MGVFDLEEQFSFYRAYHFNRVNVLIHCIFVPIILFTSIALLSLGTLGSFVPGTSVYFNLGTLMAAGFSAFYILLDSFGFIVAPALVGLSFKFTEWIRTVPDAIPYSIGLFVFAWIVQFIGHGIYEKRAPALLDNLVQALVLAPYFVFFEYMFALGFRKEVKKKMDKLALKKLGEFNRAKKAEKAEKAEKKAL